MCAVFFPCLPLALTALLTSCTQIAVGSVGCVEGGQCDSDHSSMLQSPMMIQHDASGKLHSFGESESDERAGIKSQPPREDAMSVMHLKQSALPIVPKHPSQKQVEEADHQMAEHPRPWWQNLLLFFGFIFGMLFICVLILSCLELGIRKVNRIQADLLNSLNDDKPSGTMSLDDALKEEAVEVASHITADEVKTLVNGDQARLSTLLELADSPDQSARLEDLVQKAAKASKLRLSPDSVKQTSAGLGALAEAAKAMQNKSASSSNPKERLQKAMKRVLWMVKVSRAFNIPVDKDHSEKALTCNEAHEDHHADKYAEGHKDSMHGGYKDVRLGKSAIAAYFASEKYLDHLAIGFVFVWSQACAIVYSIYLKNRFPKMYAFMGPWLLVSRGEAMAAIVLTILMVMLLSRGMITFLRNTMSWSTVLAAIVDKNVLIHRSCGMMLPLCAFLHILGHLRGSLPAIIGETDTSKINAAFTYGTKMKFNFNTWGGALRCWPAVTGYLLVLILIAFWALSNERVRRYSFELFHYPHLVLIVLWCATLIAHGWKQWLGVGIPLGALGVAPIVLWYLVERMMNIRNGNEPTIRISNAVLKKRNVLLEIDTGDSGFSYETGMYCMLKVPEISDYQWHPFTIASGGGQRKFQVLFAIVGDWTTRLSELLRESHEEKKPFPQICVRGGYGAPAEGMKDKKHIIMVGGGVGATPFLSFLSNLCNSAKNDTPSSFAGIESAVFYWVSREPEDFVWINSYNSTIASVESLKHKVSIRLCLTKSLDTTATEDCSALEVALFWLGVQVALSKFKANDLGAELGAPTQFGRPNWKKEFAAHAKQLLAKSKKVLDEKLEVAVFACGNKMLVESLEEACDETKNLSDGLSFRLYAEEF